MMQCLSDHAEFQESLFVITRGSTIVITQNNVLCFIGTYKSRKNTEKAKHDVYVNARNFRSLNDNLKKSLQNNT